MAKIILTSDRALFTDFNGSDPLGFGLCVPCRLLPGFVEYRILAPRVPVDEEGRARYAPYGLGKLEAALIASGFKREEIVIAPPDNLGRVIDEDTEVVGVHVVDPQGLAPVSWTLKVLMGGGKPCTQYEFEKLMMRLNSFKRKYKFKIVVGGPGAWQLRGREDRFGIDVLFEGEGELTFPEIVHKILSGEDVPRHVVGEQPPVDKIPLILTPSRNGSIEITRGCPRRCHFCSPTMRFFRSIPLDNILKEVRLTLEAGVRTISFVTEDVLLYGARWLNLNGEAVKKLFSETLKITREYGVNRVTFSHVTLSSALVLKDTVRFISEINDLSRENPIFPQIGLESGSPRLVAKYFAGKPYPWKHRDWPEVVINGSKLLNENYWYPCFTYIIGFPDATPEDYVLTTELLDKLRDEGFEGWTFPLFLIPMGGTLIEKRATFKMLEDLPPEAIDTIVTGWRISIRFSRKIYPKLLGTMRNKLAYKIINRLINRALDALENWVEGVAKDPTLISREFSKINIRTMPSLIKTLTKTMLHRI